MKKMALLSAILVFFSNFVAAEVPTALDSLKNSFKYQTSQIVELGNGVAQINIPTGFKFLDKKQSQFVVEKLWGNPPNETVIGMLIPETMSPIDSVMWSFVVSYDPLGYVKDSDADDIDYDDLLKKMKEEAIAANPERKKIGYATMEIIGWAAPPYYDKTTKALHWAKEIKFESSDEPTLNYDIRMLGRKGVLSFNAVGTPKDLDAIKPEISRIITSAEFVSGSKYTDFNPDVDDVAAWTLGGLVAGKVLAKAGLFAVIAKFGKVILLAIIAAGSSFMKWITGRKGEE